MCEADEDLGQCNISSESLMFINSELYIFFIYFYLFYPSATQEIKITTLILIDTDSML